MKPSNKDKITDKNTTPATKDLILQIHKLQQTGLAVWSGQANCHAINGGGVHMCLTIVNTLQ